MKRISLLFMIFVLIVSLSCIGYADDSYQGDKPTRVSEAVELRETNADTYLMSDGSYECVIYADDKYYEDAEGKLSLIDNSIVEEPYETGSKQYFYANKANSSKMHFASDRPAVRIDYNDKSIEFELEGSNDTSAVVGGSKDIKAVSDYELSGDNYLMYPDVFSGTDLIYQVKNGILKEYLVVKGSEAPSSFTFLYNSPDYGFVKTDKGVNIIDSKGEVAFELGQLFAVDSNEEYTDSLKYEIKKTDSDVRVTISIDPEYLNAPDRAFPLIIDPTTTITGANKTQDSYVCSKHPDNNYYTSPYIKTGKSGSYLIRRSYIKFTIPSSINGNGRVSSAYLRIRKNGGINPTSVRARRITGAWTSTAVTWNNKPSTASTGPIFEADTGSWFKADVTNITRMWVYGEKTNRGFELRDNVENDNDHWSTIYSSDAEEGKLPELVIDYTPKKWARLISVVSSGTDNRYSWIPPTKANLIDCTNISGATSYHSSFSVSQIKDYITDKGNSVFVIRAEGGVQDEGGSQMGTYIVTNENSSIGLSLFANIDLANEDLSHQKIVVFLGSYTGAGGPNAYNLPHAAVDCGAATAIGFKDQIDNEAFKNWIVGFSDLMKQGNTVQQACDALGNGLDPIIEINKITICGSKTTKLS
ncbi:MAG: DNRLRE domain-containing protein [Firmicutes bacterium]|nr:DNRLRE domain-containing protein [Bacillota bacterium]